MIESRCVVRAVDAESYRLGRIDWVDVTERHILALLGAQAQLAWEAQLHDRWPDGKHAVLPWSPGEDVPENTRLLFCTGTI